MKVRSRAGFTLVEVLIGSLASSVVLLAAGTMLVGSHKSWHDSWRRLDLQRDLSVAVLGMTHSIRSATRAEIDGDSHGMRVYGKSGWVRYYVPAGTLDLMCEIEGKGSRTVLENTVEEVIFSRQDGLVGMDITVRKGTIQARLTSRVVMRNYGR